MVWRNDDHTVPAEDVIVFDRAIGAEDKVMLERIPGVLPLAASATVSTQADRASVEWRRRLTDLTMRSGPGLETAGGEGVVDAGVEVGERGLDAAEDDVGDRA